MTETLKIGIFAREHSDRIEAYLYSNFWLTDDGPDHVAIVGHNVAGWTGQAQLDRLASGLIFPLRDEVLT